MLGLVHRTVLGKGPPQFRKWFFAAEKQPHRHDTRRQRSQHSKQLFDHLETRGTELLRRSALGLVRVYNALPQAAVDKPSVPSFQKWLQDDLKSRATTNTENWQNSYNLRKQSWKQVTVGAAPRQTGF